MRTYLNSIILFSAFLLAPLGMFAEGAAPVAAKGTYSYNPVVVVMVSLILILLFAIGIIGNVLRQLSQVYSEKIKEQRSSGKGIVKSLLLIAMLTLPALSAMAADAAKVVAPAAPLIEGVADQDAYLMIGMVAFELIIIIALSIYVRIMVRLIRNKPVVVVEGAPKVAAPSAFWDVWNNAVSMEKEKDILLDHDYDGIRELDNSLPPWWKYGFYVTIIVGIIYLYRYQVAGTGPNPEQEYAIEMQDAADQKAAYLAQSANNIDENNVVLSKDPADLAAGQQVFQTVCAACHAKDGGGAVGPNLTDDYWLHGGGIKEIFKTIKYGWQDKGMKSWKDDYSPKQIAQIASYIKTLHGTSPAAPKDKQGELYIESTEAPKAADTTAKTVAK